MHQRTVLHVGRVTLGKYRWPAGLIAMVILTSLACRSSRSGQPPLTPANAAIRDTTEAIVALRAAEPTLPGFQGYDAIAVNAFSQRSDDDVKLIVGRMYHDTSESISNGGRIRSRESYSRLGPEQVREALAGPAPVTRFSRSYFDTMLAETRSQVASDPPFARAINNAYDYSIFRWRDEWDNYTCIVDGFQARSSWCRHLVVFGLYDTLFVRDP